MRVSRKRAISCGFFPRKALLFALVVLAVSCGGNKPGRDVLVTAIPSGPVTLDPRLAVDAEGDKIASLICEGLMAKDDRLELVPALAESFECLSDTSYRFRLRPGVAFSDGSPLTAADVVYTFTSIIDGSIASPLKASFDRITNIVAEDERTVRIDLSAPYAPFLISLTKGIVSEAAARAAGDAFGMQPVCAGMYKLKRFVPDVEVELVANEHYHGPGPKTPALRFEIIKDDNIRVLKLLKGDIDLVQNAVPRLLIPALMRKPALRMKEDAGIVMAYVGMNLADPALAKRDVRRAMAYAIDRDEIIAHKFRGMAVKANSIIAPNIWAYDPHLKQYGYDPERAKKLLDAAGFPDPDGAGPLPRFELTLKTSTVKERVDIARMIAHQLGRVGIAARVVPYEWGTFFSDIRKGNFQIYTLSWVGIIDPDIFYEVCSSKSLPPDGLNRGGYVNREVDALVKRGRIAMDREQRKRIYDQVQEMLIEDLPFVPLWYEKNVVIYREGLKGVSVRPDASYEVFARVSKG